METTPRWNESSTKEIYRRYGITKGAANLVRAHMVRLDNEAKALYDEAEAIDVKESQRKMLSHISDCFLNVGPTSDQLSARHIEWRIDLLANLRDVLRSIADLDDGAVPDYNKLKAAAIRVEIDMAFCFLPGTAAFALRMQSMIRGEEDAER